MGVVLTDPLHITSRLMPGIKVNDSLVELRYEGVDHENHEAWRFWIEGPKLKRYTNTMTMGACSEHTVAEAAEALFSFLSHYAETTEATSMPVNVVRWCRDNAQHIDEVLSELQDQLSPPMDDIDY